MFLSSFNSIFCEQCLHAYAVRSSAIKWKVKHLHNFKFKNTSTYSDWLDREPQLKMEDNEWRGTVKCIVFHSSRHTAKLFYALEEKAWYIWQLASIYYLLFLAVNRFKIKIYIFRRPPALTLHTCMYAYAWTW